jgi:hypothetical protein
MRIATFNVENLFIRVKVMNRSDWDEGRQVLNDYSALNNLFRKDNYSDSDKNKMVSLLQRLGLEKSDDNALVLSQS